MKRDDGRRSELAAKIYLSVLGALAGLATSDRSSTFVAELTRWSGPAVVALILGGSAYAAFKLFRRMRPKRPQWPVKINPYPLLEPYDANHAPVFFGRKRDVDTLVERVMTPGPASSRFVPVVGKSGSGKSSLLMAGLIPALKDRLAWRDRIAPLLVLSRGEDPIALLAKALAGPDPANLNDEVGALKDEARKALGVLAGQDPPKPERLDSLLRGPGRRRWRRWRPRIVLVIDQLEEASLGEATDGDAFMALLRAALTADDRLVIVAALRSESVSRFQRGPGSDLVANQHDVKSIPDELAEVITGPARATKTVIDRRLVDRMVQDAHTATDPLPELSYTLHELYESYALDRLITADEYDSARGGDGGIARRAEEALDQVVGSMPELGSEARLLVLNTWLSFVNLDGSSRTRRRAPLGDLSSVAREIVAVFETFQLLTINQDERGETVVDVKQETVLRAWPRLVDHITEHAAVLSERAQLEPLARKWHESGRDDAYLVLKADQARRAVQNDLLRSGLLGEFLRASIDIDPADQISKNAATEAIRIVQRDPEEAIRIAQAAVELKPTTDARFALYRTWASGLRAVFRTPDSEPTSVAWSADGRLAWGSDDGQIRIRSADGQTRVMPGHTRPVRTLAWSADGRLASGSDDTTIRLWSSDGLRSDVLTGHTGPVTAVDWSVDGRLASGSADATVRIWPSSGQAPLELNDHEGAVTSVAWSFDGRLASASVDTRVRVWGADMTMQVLNGHTQPVRSVAWSLDGKLASGSDDRKVRVSANGQLEYQLTGHGGGVRTVGWTRDGRLVTGCADKTIRVWGGKQLLHKFDGHDGAVVSVAWAPDGRLASASTDKAVRIWGRTQELVQSLPGHAGTVVSVAWSPDGRLASGSTDRSVRVWAADGQLQGPYPVYAKGKRAEPPLAWSVDRRLAFGGGFTDPSMLILAPNGKLSGSKPNSGNAVVSLAWSHPQQGAGPDAAPAWLAIGSNNGVVRVRPTNGGRPRDLKGHTARVGSVAWSLDGWLASGSDDHTARLWHLDGATHVLPGHEGSVRSVAWSPRGYLASGSDDTTIRIWGPDGQPIRVLTGHDGPVRSVAWSTDGLLASASDDATIRIWSSDGHLLEEFTGHDRAVTSVAWSPDGRLASGSEDTTVKIWPALGPVTELLPVVASAPGLRELTTDRRRSLLLPAVRPLHSLQAA